MTAHNLIITEDINRVLNIPLDWQKFAGKTVLITGAGAIALYLIKALLTLNKGVLQDNPVRVMSMVRNLAKAQAGLGCFAEDPFLTFVVADVSSSWAIETPVHWVVHAASPASPIDYLKYPVATIDANTTGTHNLLKLASRNACEGFLFISSSEVYGEPEPGQTVLTETTMGRIDPLSERAAYAESKRLGEALCMAWCREHKMPIKIARLFHTYGPGMRLGDGRIFSDLVLNMLEGKDLVLNSAGTAQRTFCYLSDSLSGILTILLSGAPGEAYNVGNDQTLISIKALAELLVTLNGQGAQKVLYQQSESVNVKTSALSVVCLDSCKLRQLGWEPDIGLKEGFARTLKSYELEKVVN